MHLGEKIKLLRKEKGWSQDELAEKIDNNGRQISRYENGKITPSTDVIVKLAEIFNTSVDYLLFDDVPRSTLKFKHNEILEKIRNLDDLTTEDKNALLSILDAYNAKYQMKKLAKSIS